MAETKYKTVSVMLSEREAEIIDQIRRVQYKKSQSEIVRDLIVAGAERLGIIPTEKEQ